MASSSNYRYEFIKAHPGVKRPGKIGYWYRCASCGKWCGRPGKGNSISSIPLSSRMEVDHIKPWIKGGSDAVFNLQAMCHDCNRAKSANPSGKDQLKTAVNTVIHPVDAIGGVFRKGARNNKILKGLGITKRK